MKPHVGFVLEQTLGHVAYGGALRRALSGRPDVDCQWLEVSFEEKPFAGRVPVLGENFVLREYYRARRSIAQAHRRRPFDTLFVHTPSISILSGDYIARIPTLLSLSRGPIPDAHHRR